MRGSGKSVSLATTLVCALLFSGCQSSDSAESSTELNNQQTAALQQSETRTTPGPDQVRLVSESSAYREMHSGDAGEAANQYRVLAANVRPSGPKYYEQYEYVSRAKLIGNAAFSDLAAGNVEAAKSGFVQSMEILSEGISGHSLHLEAKARNQRQTANALTMIAGVGLAVLGVRASNNNPAAAQQISDSLSQAFDSLGRINTLIHNRITQIKESAINSNARGGVDGDLWRTVVVSEHPVPASVVRIETGNSHCTGFYIQPRLVATSAHCINPGTLSEVIHHSPSDPKAFITGMGVSKNPVVYQFVHPSYDGSVCNRFDVALLVVRHKSGAHLPVDTSSAATLGNGMIMGYSGDLNSGFFKQLDYGCPIKGREGGMISHQCASSGGNSGGPLMAVRNGRINAIGVHSCGQKTTTGTRLGFKGSAHISELKLLYDELVRQDPGLGVAGLLD